MDTLKLVNKSALARKIGVSPQAVQQWVAAGRVPPRRAVQVAAILHVHPSDLCPDVFIERADAEAARKEPGHD